MQTGNVFIAHPSNDEQLNALKAFLKALKIKFEVTNLENSYKPEFVAKIKKRGCRRRASGQRQRGVTEGRGAAAG